MLSPLLALISLAFSQRTCAVLLIPSYPPGILGTAAPFAALAHDTLTNSPGAASVLVGDAGLYKTSVTGFPPGIITGTLYIADAVAMKALVDATTAYNDLKGQLLPKHLSTLDGQTLLPGVYSASSSLQLAGSGAAKLTLDAANNPHAVWVFQIGSTLTTGAGGVATMAMIRGGSPLNVYWQVSSSATLGISNPSFFLGNIIAEDSVSIGSGVILGTVVALTGAITIADAICIGWLTLYIR